MYHKKNLFIIPLRKEISMEDVIRSFIKFDSKYVVANMFKVPGTDRTVVDFFVTLPTNNKIIRKSKIFYDNELAKMSSEDIDNLPRIAWDRLEPSIIKKATILWSKNSEFGKKDLDLPEEFTKVSEESKADVEIVEDEDVVDDTETLDNTDELAQEFYTEANDQDDENFVDKL